MTAGWLLADAAVFTEHGAASAALALAGDAALALGLGAVIGLLLGGPLRSVVALALVGVAAAASLAIRLPIPATAVIGLRVCLLWGLAFVAAGLLRPRGSGRHWLRAALGGLGLGAAAAVAQISMHYGLSDQGLRILFGAGVLVAAGVWRSPPVSALIGACAVLWLLWPGVAAGRDAEALRRADLAAPTGSAPDPALPSLLLVVLDTVRADRLGCYGYDERDTTPNLDRFATAATRYTQARSASSWTLPSHATLLTGLRPAQHGATHPRAGGDESTLDPAWPAQPLRADVTTLAERLRERGYVTGAIVSNPLYLRHEFGLDRGFQHYDDRDPAAVPRYLALPQLFGRKPWVANLGYRDAEQITDLALAWLDQYARGAAAGAQDGRPFFLMLNYMDAHMPYVPAAPFDRAFSDLRPERPLAAPRELHSLLYDRELAYLDHHVGRLLDGLAEVGDGADLAVVITSDHGEAFGEHGFWKHDWTLYDEVVRVPLLVRSRSHAARVDDTPVDGTDVHALRAGLAGLQLPPLGAGFPAVTSEWYRVEDDDAWEARFGGVDLDRDLLAWVEDGRKFVVSSAGSVEVYDLAADPGELAPLALAPEVLEAARERARQWWRAHPPPDLATGDLDPETLERMRALGYLDDGKD